MMIACTNTACPNYAAPYQHDSDELPECSFCNQTMSEVTEAGLEAALTQVKVTVDPAPTVPAPVTPDPLVPASVASQAAVAAAMATVAITSPNLTQAQKDSIQSQVQSQVDQTVNQALGI